MKHREIIRQLNRENAFRLWIQTFLVGLTILPFIAACLLLAYCYAPEIDAFASRHSMFIAWIMVIVPLVIIVKREL